MKKLLFGLALTSVMALGTNNSVKAQAVQEGNLLIDAYYGFPDLFKATLKTTYANSGTTTNISISGVGPVGGKVELMLSDLIGLGLDVNYVSSGVSYNDVSTDSIGNTVVYNYSVTRNVLRVLPRLNFHYGNSDVLDAYSGVGVGYRTSSWKFQSNDPNYSDSSIGGFIPVSFRLFTGIRYFFSDNIGLNAEFGLGGGALIQGGLSVKF